MANSEIKWTKEQQEVVFSDSNKMIVSASAGSGKTFVMIKRIVEILKTKRVPLDAFLVVTFTKAAASGMKAKLLDELEELEVKDDFIKSQIHDISVSNICTLDSFCAKLLKTYFYEVELDPAFVVIDDVEKTHLQNKAFDKLFNECFENFDKDFFELADILSSNRRLDSMKDVVLKVYNFLNVQPNPKMFFEKKLNVSYDTNLNNNPCVEIVNKNIFETIAPYKNKLADLKKSVINIKNQTLLQIFGEVNANLLRFNENNSFCENLRAISLFEKVDISKPRNVQEDELFFAEQICELKNELNELDNRYFSLFEEDEVSVKLALETSKQRTVKLFELVTRFGEIYASLKKDNAMLDFSDLERKVFELLQKQTVIDSIKNKIQYVFVDEFQDINMLQDEILQKLSQNGNVFLVGDAKQSIYGFRHCNPQIFLDKQTEFKNDKDGKVVFLNHNFRSHKEILDFANSVFVRTMDKHFSGVDYKNEAMLKKGTNEIGKGDDPNNAVSIINILKDKKSKKENEPFEFYSVLNHCNNEDDNFENGELAGRVLANEILKVKERNIYLPKSKSKKERKASFSDIVILVNSRDKALENICKELDKCNIPYSTDVDEQIFDDDFMCTLLNYLKIINNKNLDFEMISVLKFMGCSFNELAEIKNNTSKHNYFYECVKEYIANENFVGELKNKLKMFEQKIERFSFLSGFLTVSDLICEIVKEEKLELFAMDLKDSSKKLLKLDKLLESLNGKSYNENLGKYILNLDEANSTFQNVSQNDAVKITTIHKSKGLEYPIVFMPFVNKEFNMTDFNGDILLDKKFGICLNNFDVKTRTKFPTICMLAGKINSKEEMVKEKLRLFYVALTRPINKLFLIQTIDETQNKQLSLKSSKSFTHLLDYLIYDKVNKKLNEEECKFDLLYIYEKDVEKIKNEKYIRSVEFTENFATLDKTKNNLIDIFENKYKYKDAFKLPQKVSVSEINNKEKEENVFYLFDENSSSAEIGNAYHKLLSLINLRLNSEKEINEQINNLIKTGVVFQEEINLIDLKEIYNLINNEFLISLLKMNPQVLKEQQFFSLMNSGEIYGNNTNENIIVFGICDLILKFENKIIVIDYKTSKIKNEKILIEKYAKQLKIYSKALEENYREKNIEAFIYSFELNKFLMV